MVYRTSDDVFRDFRSCYVPPSCCGRLHWDARRLEVWLLKRTMWNGLWHHLSPALVQRAARVSARSRCPLDSRITRGDFGLAASF